jgi:hypothetical protein
MSKTQWAVLLGYAMLLGMLSEVLGWHIPVRMRQPTSWDGVLLNIVMYTNRGMMIMLIGLLLMSTIISVCHRLRRQPVERNVDTWWEDEENQS